MPHVRALLAPIALAAALAAPPAFADAVCDGRIVAVGEGEARAVPDIAYVTLRVEAEAKTSSQALREAAAKAEAVIAALAAAGVAEKDVATVDVSLHPVHSRPREGEASRVVGYVAGSGLRATLRDLGGFGAVVDSAVEAGASRVSSPSLAIDDRESLADAARADAVGDARRKAEGMAGAAELTLGAVLEMGEDGASPRPPMPMRAMAMASEAASDMPIAAGEQGVTARVRMVFQLCE